MRCVLGGVGQQVGEYLRQTLGVTVKDSDLGLLDFPARRDGEDVELCWHVGEEAVAFWHRIGEGYAGRKPVDWED